MDSCNHAPSSTSLLICCQRVQWWSFLVFFGWGLMYQTIWRIIKMVENEREEEGKLSMADSRLPMAGGEQQPWIAWGAKTPTIWSNILIRRAVAASSCVVGK